MVPRLAKISRWSSFGDDGNFVTFSVRMMVNFIRTKILWFSRYKRSKVQTNGQFLTLRYLYSKGVMCAFAWMRTSLARLLKLLKIERNSIGLTIGELDNVSTVIPIVSLCSIFFSRGTTNHHSTLEGGDVLKRTPLRHATAARLQVFNQKVMYFKTYIQ